MKQASTWILIADGGKARVLVSEGRGAKLVEHDKLNLQAEAIPHAAPGTQAPTRVQESASTERHAIEPRMTPKRQAENDFAREVADRLDSEIANYDRLIIVAAPKMLGDLREFISTAVGTKLETTIAKDLTNTPNNEIAGHLGEAKL